MIVLDEELQGLGLEETISRWYRGSVILITTFGDCSNRPNSKPKTRGWEKSSWGARVVSSITASTKT
jgi:hypothetical protein